MDIHQIISAMTLEEKLLMLGGKDGWHFYGVERLGIPDIRVCDGPHGIRVHTDQNEVYLPATNLPTASAMASSFNTELMTQAGAMLGQECRHYGVQVLLGPGVNGKRSPLAGRNFEYYSEDPYLSGKIAAAFINGVQSQKVGTSLKHYIANEQETSRLFISSKVDERTLHEIYLTPFEMAIQEANPWTIMGSYNRINGTYGCENQHTLNEILKGDLKYDGLVVSDWGAVNDKVDSHKYGLDIQMPGPVAVDERLKQAVLSGEIPMSVIDDHVQRCLRLNERVFKPGDTVETDLDKNHVFAQKIAAESIVLLKNEKILPLKKNTKIAVIGRFADDQVRYNGGGSSWLKAYKIERPLEALKDKAKVLYAAGYDQEKVTKTLTDEALAAASKVKTVLFFTGTTASIESEGFDRLSIDLPKQHLALLKKIHKINPNIVVILNNGAAVDLREVQPYSKAIVEAWLLGSAAGVPLADILFGDVNPSGRLSETFPLRLEHTPAYGCFPGNRDEIVYTEGLLTGYRHYETRKLPVMYPFGYGLSYTTFKLSSPRLSATSIKKNQPVTLSVFLKNTGKVAGSQVVQLYVKDQESFLPRPEKELRAFQKVSLKPGESKAISFTLNQRDFAYYVPHLNRFAVESGTFELCVGFSSQDIVVCETLEVISEDKVRPHLTLDYPYNQWMKYPLERTQVTKLVKATRDPFWWDSEPPLRRWLNSLKHEFNWSDEKLEEMKTMLMEEE
jgi:beta-glucosidase